MNDRPDVFAQYLKAVRAAIDAIEATQLPAIREAAAHFATTILKGRLVHVFGTGHSRMAVEEMFPRYGSFPGFHPIVELSMTYHNPVVGANGQRQAMFLENVQGFGPVLWRNFATSPDDALLAISTSGCNAVTIDVALEARRLGMFVVALTSMEHSPRSRPRGMSRARSSMRSPTWCSTRKPRQATRPSGSQDWRRRFRRYRASAAVRSSTWSRPRSRGYSPRPARHRRSSRPPATSAPSELASSSRKPTTTTAAAWA